MMICMSLNSGSNGNCIYVEAGGVRLLLDAGISGKRTAERLASAGRDVRDVDAVIISHDHCDHIGCAGVLNRKFGLSVYMTEPTYRSGGRYALGEFSDLRFFAAGETIDLGALRVETYPTPHDADDGVAFVIAAEGKRLGVLTDLGHVFDGLAPLLAELDALYIESNYDPHMLAAGSYPAFVKRRIVGAHGHLSNAEAAELVSGAANGRLQWVSLAHLSENNNSPAVALETYGHIAGDARPVHLAGRHGPGELLRIE